MRGEKYVSEFWNIARENNVLKLVLLSLILIIIIEGLFVVKVMYTQRTIVIPSVRGKYEFTDTKASPDYLVNMGIFLADLVENFTPATIKSNYERFLSFFSPAGYSKAQGVLMANAEQYITGNVSSLFAVKKVRLYPGRIVIQGRRKLIVAGKVISDEPINVVIYYLIKNGKFEVVSYEENKNKKQNLR